MRFLDANVFLRYLTRDNPDQAARAYALLQKVETGEVIATTTEAVLAEVVYVLSSKTLYNVPRAEIQARLAVILSLKGLHLRPKAMYLRALDLYATVNIDFVDALLVAHVERTAGAVLVSFDRNYSKTPGVSHEEP